MATTELSPIMKQFYDLKAKHPDALLLFRCGDFYETYKQDAEDAARILGITLTVNIKTLDMEGKPVRMAGFPHHALDTYLPKLIRAGRRVAICDQLEDDTRTKTLVKRGITELVKPNETSNQVEPNTTNDNLDAKTNKSMEDIIIDYKNLCADYEAASMAYYQESKPIMSDADFDTLQSDIRKMLDEHPELIKVCNPFATPQDDHVQGFKKVTRKVPMLSLRDIYTREEVEQWWNSVGSVPVSVEAKLDGLSLSLIYEGGKLVQASTRGTGFEGDDVTRQALMITNIPNDFGVFDTNIEVRGEVCMPIEMWKMWNKTHDEKHQLANPRNGASGALKTLDPMAVCEKGLQFYAYYAIDNIHNDQDYNLGYLEHMGFDTLPHQPYVAETLDEIMWAIENVKEQRGQYAMGIDGVVLKVNNTSVWASLGNTDKFHKFGIAFKFKAEAMKSKLLRVVWQVAESGRVTPVAEYEPIEMFGTTCQRATLNNIGWIKKNLGELRIGDTLLLTKGGDIIPKITGVEHRKPTGMDIVCPHSWQSNYADNKSVTQIGGIVTTPSMIGANPTYMEGAYLMVETSPNPSQGGEQVVTESSGTPTTQSNQQTSLSLGEGRGEVAGKTFYITGTYYEDGKKSPQRRKDLKRMVCQYGGILQEKFNAKTCDYLVMGENAGQAKVQEMQSMGKGDGCISENQFISMI